MNKEIEIPEGYEARIDGNKVIIEQKESEDERIRKDIMEAVENWLPYERVEEIRYYLNRQKERQNNSDAPNESSLDGAISSLKNGRNLDELAREYIDGVKQYHSTPTWDLMQTAVCYGYHLGEEVGSEGVESEKPAEWSEEEEKMFTDISWAVWCHIYDDKKKERLNDFLKTLHLRPHPKQEVVDRTVFDRIADIIRWCYLPVGCPVENFKESESEREHLLEIVQCVAHRYANSCAYCKEYSRGYQDGLNVPHWKPSEEQMMALEHFIRSWGESGTMSPQNTILCAANSLLIDLQKLL